MPPDPRELPKLDDLYKWLSQIANDPNVGRRPDFKQIYALIMQRAEMWDQAQNVTGGHPDRIWYTRKSFPMSAYKQPLGGLMRLMSEQAGRNNLVSGMGDLWMKLVGPEMVRQSPELFQWLNPNERA